MRRDKSNAAAAPAGNSKAGQASEGPYVVDGQVGFLMRAAIQRHNAIFASRMIESLTQTQFAALAKLNESGSCSQNHLGRLICLDAATIKGVVDRLIARGFVVALADPKDRRRRSVTLTEQGRQVTQAAIKVAGEINAATLTPLNAEEESTVVKLLKRLT